MELDLDRVRDNIERADTEDLLDRATVYRAEMEPEALEMIDDELRKRRITTADMRAHLENRRFVVTRHDETVVKCSFCYRPAIGSGRSWFRLLGYVPLFPMRVAWCQEHLPVPESTKTNAQNDAITES